MPSKSRFLGLDFLTSPVFSLSIFKFYFCPDKIFKIDKDKGNN